MKHIYLLFIVFVVFQSQAQKEIVFSPVDDIPEIGVSLANYWKWRAGDNKLWAKPDFNDSLWNKIAVLESMNDHPDLAKAKIAWLRRPMQVTKEFVNKPLTLIVSQMGASEIYLDGVLLHKLGVVSADPSKEKTQAYATALPINMADTNIHVLAVRYSFSGNNFFYPGTNSQIFGLKIFKTQDIGSFIERKSHRSVGFNYLFAGVFLVFALLHFLFFVSNPVKKVSLSLGLTMLFLTIGFFLRGFEQIQTDVSKREILSLITLTATYLGILLINVSLYQYLNQKYGIIFYVVALLVTGGLLCNIFAIELPFYVEVWVPFLLLFVDFIRVSVLAEKRGDSNAKVPIYSLVVVAFSAVAGVITLMIGGFSGAGSDSIVLTIGLFIIVIMFFSIPIGLSLSLVREYSRTHKSLIKKLIEIEELSAENLAHEQEKQQILTAQNEMLEKQVAERTAELARSLDDLKKTQTQLIQSEKLASLGELTAGIAHEIQNPLNFVNNFSELSKELIDELQEERARPERDEALEEELLGDIAQNLEKINHHGKRASSIVRGMLEHSRSSTGKKEPTDINAMAEEYLRLAYHGIRAKDKSFNADFKTDLDANLPKVPVIAQDFGRVLLNLINNAFYAIKDMEGKGQVIVQTRQTGNQIEIKVTDNGVGIPDAVKSKIFQPFFTTKPTGQGTGLGLSLAYDIITKGHGGTLNVETKEGEGTTFVIKLPYL
ncbi:sensor histidine kinase [Emticicia sp. TH156]|uniref:sensor histidine kinase n=1 Tax=Emticicia sp. TH156 TaxID=2067454 RepID=UPI001E36FB5D|nr:ATP-binding protein [Emticicia sp. TH156]